MDKELKNWLAMVDYDVKTANQMLKTGRYVYVIFMCHLSIEKALKAVICWKTKRLPSRTHDLVYLTKESGVILPDDLLIFIGIINNASTATRYPEELSKLVSSYPKAITQKYFNKTREIVLWLKKYLRSGK